jgi:hypothetical protein
MELTQNTRLLIATLTVAAATIGLAACATGPSPSEAGRAAITHRMVVRESGDRYVRELIERARTASQSDDGRDAVPPAPAYRDQVERRPALVPDPAPEPHGPDQVERRLLLFG